MNEMQKVFNFGGNDVRTIVKGNEVWFVAKDVCEVLEIRNSRMALQRLDEDEKGVNSIDTLGGTQSISTVNESGLYTLILGSRKPEARQFKRWVTHEVLPTIRKHGAYMTEDVLDQALGNPDFMIGLLENLKQERTMRLQLEQKIELDAPKVSYYDTILESTNAVNVTQIAQDYGLSAQKLNAILAEERVQRRVGNQWVLFSRYMSEGFTKTKTQIYGRGLARMHTRWTQKGRLFIHELLAKKGIYPIGETVA